MRNPSKCLPALLLLAAMAVAAAPSKAIPLDVSGEGVQVVTVVKSLPCMVKAPAGKGIWIWQFPDAVKAKPDPENQNVLIVTAAPKGTHLITVINVRYDKAIDDLVKVNGEVNLTVGEGPAPPDPPVPPVPPTPPAPAGPMRVLIVYEQADVPAMKKDPARKAQAEMLFSPSFKGALTDRSDKKGPNGIGWAIWDKDAKFGDKADKFWKDAFARPRTALPFIHVFKGDKPVHEGELPKNEKEALDLINKYAGE